MRLPRRRIIRYIPKEYLIDFNSTADLTDNFTIDNVANINYTVSGGILTWKALSTDHCALFKRTFANYGVLPREIEFKCWWSGSIPGFETWNFRLISSKTLFGYIARNSGPSWTSYLPYQGSYTDKALITNQTWGGGTVYWSGSMLSVNQLHVYKYTKKSGNTWGFYIDDVHIYSLDMQSDVTLMYFDVLSGWWQTSYPFNMEYYIERY